MLSTHTKNKSDTLSNNVVLEKKKINTENVPICIPTIQNFIPKSTGTTSTKNNMTVGNETEKSSSSGMISTTEKKQFFDLIDLDRKITTTKTISIKKIKY